MSLTKEYFIKPGPECFAPYIRKVSNQPPLDVRKLDLDLLIGNERSMLKTPTTADASIVLFYRKREGSVASFELSPEELSVVQLQGSTQEGYRVNTSFKWIIFFAHEIREIATQPDTELSRITLPPFLAIRGLVDATESAVRRYEEFTSTLGMKYSREEDRFVVELT